MPLSKKRNRDRMRKTRLHKRLVKTLEQLSPPVESKPVQPKPIFNADSDSLPWWDRPGTPVMDIDADGNIMPDYT